MVLKPAELHGFDVAWAEASLLSFPADSGLDSLNPVYRSQSNIFGRANFCAP